MARSFKLGNLVGLSFGKNSYSVEFSQDPKRPLVDVCIFTEGTYPFVKGGVSSVIHQIIENHPHLTFGIVHIAWDKKSPAKNLYPELPHIKWVDKILLNDETKHLPSARVKKQDVMNFLKLITKLGKAQRPDIETFYNDYINPDKRKVDFRTIITSENFFSIMMDTFTEYDISLSDLYWLQKEYILLASSLFDHKFPKARVYHSHTNGYAGLAAAMAALQHNRKFVLTEHSLYIRDVMHEIETIFGGEGRGVNSVRKQIWEQWFSIIGKITYAISSQNTYLYDQIADDAKTFGSERQRSIIIPNGIKYEQFEIARKKQEERHPTRFQGKASWKLGFIGRIVPVKGVKDLLLATNILRKNFNQSFEMHLIGPAEEDPKYYKECLELTKKHGLEDIVFFHGPQNVAKFLEDIDLVVMSSHSEALPVVVLEAMAAGVPIISTDVGSVQDILCAPLADDSEGTSVLEAGLVVPPQNPRELAQGIIRLLQDPESYERYKANGPKRVQHSFKIEDIMKKYTGLYLENL